MKTTTFLKRTIRTASFLTILLVLISFKNEKPTSQNSLESSKELVLNAENLDSLAIPIRNQDVQLPSKDAYVLLEIDTEKINERNLDSTVVFINVGEDPTTNSGNPKDFLTIVYKNMKINWKGAPKDINSSAIIDILNIERKEEGGAKILKFSTKKNEKKGVEIKIKNKKIDGQEFYKVKFSITEGNLVRTFEVDPKLQMGP
jgi:hypothetical protein